MLKQIAEANPGTADKIKDLLPNQDQQDIKDQQKKINLLRRLQQRIQKKESQIKTKEQQMENFIEQVKAHVTKEKARHKEEVECLKKEIEQAKTDLQKIKDGEQMEAQNQEDMDLEEVLDVSAPDVEKDQLRGRLAEAEKANQEMQQQLASFQNQMAEFMQQYSQQLQRQELPVGTPPGAFSPGQMIKNPMNTFEPGTNHGPTEEKTNKRDARQPFGIAKKERQKDGPYTANRREVVGEKSPVKLNGLDV